MGKSVLGCLFIFLCILTISEEAKPNILFIVVDDLRPALRVYGDENAYTPNIDKLAGSSFLFTNAYAQQALCAPSRNSFLTSRRPDSLHLYDFYSYWRDTVGNFTTVPQYFKENGYHTHSVGKVFHPGISSNFSDDSPYSWSEKPFHPSTEKYKDAKVCMASDGDLASNLICPVIVEQQPEGILPDQESLIAATEFLKNRGNASQPYFLAVGFHKPHIPFKYPVHYQDYYPLENIKLPVNRFQPSSLPSVAWNPWMDVKKRDDMQKLNISFPFGRMPDEVILKVIQSYKASVSYVDDLIGQLLENVDSNTIIVLFGDHGWSLGEHGEFAKYSNYEMAVHVPLIIKVPKLSNSEIISNNLVELVDLFPTLVDLAGFQTGVQTCPENTVMQLCTEGQSLVPLMVSAVHQKEYKRKRAVFNQYPRPGTYPTKHPNSDKPRLHEIKIMGYSMRTEQFRFTQWVDFDHETFTANWTNVYATELYDHTFDPIETNNLAGREGLQDLEEMLTKKLIEGWRYA